MLAKILLVEDNPLTAKGLQYLLEREKYQVITALNAKEARQAVLDDINLILLDVTLPDGDGFGLAREFQRERKQIPIIFLTAKDDSADVVCGLELGAEDYIAKPFHNRELLLRVQRIFRHNNEVAAGSKFGDLELSLENHSVLVADKLVILTALEYRILQTLIENQEGIVTRQKLLDEIWAASGKVVNDNTVSVYMKRLRKKIGEARIETVKSLGYRLHRMRGKSE